MQAEQIDSEFKIEWNNFHVKLFRDNRLIGEAEFPRAVNDSTLNNFINELTKNLSESEKLKLSPKIMVKCREFYLEAIDSTQRKIYSNVSYEIFEDFASEIRKRIEVIKSETAEKILQENVIYNLKGELLVKRGLLFITEPQSLKFIESQILSRYYELELDKYKISRRTFVDDILKEVRIRSEEIEEDRLNNNKFIVFKNCILNKETLEIYEGNDYVFTSSTNVDLDLDFLVQLQQDKVKEDYFVNMPFYKAIRRFYDDENFERLKLLLGSTLSPFSLRLIGFINGEPKTGKSTLANLIKKTLGSYVCSVNFDSLAYYPFASEPFIHANINVVEEAPDKVIRYLERIKALVGGSVLSIPRKYKQTLTLEGKPIFILSFCNNLPIFENVDEAFADRIVIVQTQNPLREEEVNENLQQELFSQESLKQFASFLLYCYSELRKKNYKIKRDIYLVMELLSKASFPLNDFIQECFSEDNQAKVQREEAYARFVEWSKENPTKVRKVYSRREFYSIMRTRFQEIEYYGNYYFKGLRLIKGNS